MKSELDSFDLETPGETATVKEDDAEMGMDDDKLGLALKRALAGGNGAAICEMIRNIVDGT